MCNATLSNTFYQCGKVFIHFLMNLCLDFFGWFQHLTNKKTDRRCVVVNNWADINETAGINHVHKNHRWIYFAVKSTLPGTRMLDTRTHLTHNRHCHR